MSTVFQNNLNNFLCEYAMLPTTVIIFEEESRNTYFQESLLRLSKINADAVFEIKTEDENTVSLRIKPLSDEDKTKLCNFLDIKADPNNPDVYVIPTPKLLTVLAAIRQQTKDTMANDPSKIMPYVNVKFGILIFTVGLLEALQKIDSNDEIVELRQTLQKLAQSYIKIKPETIEVNTEKFFAAQGEFKSIQAKLHQIADQNPKAAQVLMLDKFENLLNTVTYKWKIEQQQSLSSQSSVASHHASIFTTQLSEQMWYNSQHKISLTR